MKKPGRVLFVLIGVACLALLTGCEANSPPLAVLSAQEISGPAPFAATFDLSLCEDPDGDPLTFCLDFGDGSEPAAGTRFRVTVHHTYVDEGSFLAALTITDAVGNQAHDETAITVSRDAPPTGLAVGLTAPDFTGHLTEGGDLTLAETRGSLVVLEFWGAWCAPCRRFMPHIQELYDLYSEDGLVVVAVSTDRDEDEAVAFLEVEGYDDFISVWEPGYKRNNPIAKLYEVTTFPRTFFLDRQGVIRYIGHPKDLQSGFVEAFL